MAPYNQVHTTHLAPLCLHAWLENYTDSTLIQGSNNLLILIKHDFFLILIL